MGQLTILTRTLTDEALGIRVSHLERPCPSLNISPISQSYNHNLFQNELKTQEKSTDIANFKSEFAIVYERKQAERKRDKYKRLLSYENLALYPDYQRRLMVLRELNYIDEHDSVILKGRVACGMGTNELIISELVFRNVFTDKNPAEIAALLSCFVFQARTQIEQLLTEKLTEGVKAIEQIDAELSKIESKYLVRKMTSTVSIIMNNIKFITKIT